MRYLFSIRILSKKAKFIILLEKETKEGDSPV